MAVSLLGCSKPLFGAGLANVFFLCVVVLKLLVCVHACVTGGQQKLFDPVSNTGLIISRLSSL